MKATIPVRGIGSKGVSEDVPPSELGLEYFNFAANVYSQDQKLKNVPLLEEALAGSHGEVQWFGFRLDEESREPEIIYVGRNTSTGVDNLYIIKKANLTNLDGTQKGIVASRVTAYSNISADPYARWQGFVANGVCVLTNGVDVPQLLPLGDDVFIDLPNWNVLWSCKAIMPFKGAWIAMNIIDASAPAGQERQGNVVRWSSPITDYATPPLWWAELDGSGNPTGAGYNPLGDTPGECVMGRTLRDAFLVYKTDSVVRMDFSGNPNVPFTFRTIFEDTGAWGTNGVVALRNEHLVVGNNDVYITDGFNKRSIISSKVKDRFDKLVFSSTYAYDVIAVPNYANEEAFILIRTKTSAGAFQTQVLVYNYAQDQWFNRSFPEVSYVAFAGNGALSEGDPVTFNIWDDADGMAWDPPTPSEWESTSEQWDNFSNVLSLPYTFFAADLKFYNYGPYRNALTGQDCVVHKYDMDFNDILGSTSDNIKRVLRLYPIVDPESKGYLIFKLWGHDRPGQVVAEADKKWYLFNSAADHKVDVTVSGRYISMEILTDAELLTNWFDYTFLNNPTAPTVNPSNQMALAGIDMTLAVLQGR